MKPNLLQAPTRQDGALLRNTLLKLTAVQKILCTVVIMAVILIWYDLLNRLIKFGHGVDYSGLHALGAQAVEFLNLYNPFFWWAIVVLCTLIIAYFLYCFVQRSLRRVRSKLVSAQTIHELSAGLSESAREVLVWAWNDRRDPITVGDLQRAAHEIRSGRVRKINLAREHSAALDARRPDAPETASLQSP